MPILVVDDEEEIRRSLKEMLTRAGYSVVTAADGRAALEYMRASGGGVKMMLIDLSMPVMSGEDLIASLKLENRMPPAIVVSASSPMSMSMKFREFGLGFVRKPVDGRLLLSEVESIMRKESLHGDTVPR